MKWEKTDVGTLAPVVILQTEAHRVVLRTQNYTNNKGKLEIPLVSVELKQMDAMFQESWIPVTKHEEERPAFAGTLYRLAKEIAEAEVQLKEILHRYHPSGLEEKTLAELIELVKVAIRVEISCAGPL